MFKLLSNFGYIARYSKERAKKQREIIYIISNMIEILKRNEMKNWGEKVEERK